MTLSLSDIQTPLTREQARESLLATLTELGFPVAAWQEEGVARSLVEACAALIAQQSEVLSVIAQMAFLDTSSSTLLDALALSHYQLTRLAGARARLSVTLSNSSSTTYGPIAAGGIQLRALDGLTFASVASATMNANSATVVQFDAADIGSAGNIPAQTLTMVTPFAGVSAVYADVLVAAGADAETDAALRARCRAQWGTLRIERASLGVEALARNASAAVALTAVNARAPRGPGTLDVYLAGQDGAVGGADVTAVQTALDAAFFGNYPGATVPAALAIAATTQTLPVTATLYIQAADAAAVDAAARAAWVEFVRTIPLGGFDLSPGPTNIILRSQIADAFGSVAGVVAVDVTTPAADVTIPALVKVETPALADPALTVVLVQ